LSTGLLRSASDHTKVSDTFVQLCRAPAFDLIALTPAMVVSGEIEERADEDLDGFNVARAVSLLAERERPDPAAGRLRIKVGLEFDIQSWGEQEESRDRR
jgi:hypothetical protein